MQVRERIGYDASQIQGLIRIRQDIGQENSCCCDETDDDAAVSELAAACAGKIWSAKIFARKPNAEDD